LQNGSLQNGSAPSLYDAAGDRPTSARTKKMSAIIAQI
jgi:hypothetical protein